MQTVRVHDKEFALYLSKTQIESAIKKLAADINIDYAGERPIFIGILNGSFMFAAELFKHLTISCEICFIKLASYKGTTSSRNIITSIGIDDTDFTNKHVIVLEDIVDTGNTLKQFLPQIKEQDTASLKLAALLYKPEAGLHEIKPDYNCFEIPNKFVIGFGLDYDGLGRNFPHLYQLNED